MVLGKNSGESWFLQVVFILVSRFFMPRYDVRLQILKYQIQMLRNRIDDPIDDPRIITEECERAELMRLGALIDHDISDVMLVVKPKTYRAWLRKKPGKKPTRKGGRPETEERHTNPHPSTFPHTPHIKRIYVLVSCIKHNYIVSK